MTIKETLEAAQKAKSLISINPRFKKWSKAGEEVCGEFLGSTEMTNDEGKITYYQFIMKDDESPLKFSISAHIAEAVLPSMKVGNIYLVKFEGQEKTSGGFNANVFTVAEVPRIG